MSRKNKGTKKQGPEAALSAPSTQALAPDVQPVAQTQEAGAPAPEVKTAAPEVKDVKVQLPIGKGMVATVPVKAKKSKHPRLTEAQIIERYPHVIPGSLRYELEGPHANKQTVLAHMTCGHDVRLATSDLFQIHVCKECRKASKKAPRSGEAQATAGAKPKTKAEKEQHAKTNNQAVAEAHKQRTSPEAKPSMASTRMPSADARKAALANA